MANSNYFWSSDQKTRLGNAYKLGGLTAAQKALPEKNRGQIATQACRLGLTTPKPRKTKSP